jgi:hypothetical protein
MLCDGPGSYCFSASLPGQLIRVVESTSDGRPVIATKTVGDDFTGVINMPAIHVAYTGDYSAMLVSVIQNAAAAAITGAMDIPTGSNAQPSGSNSAPSESGTSTATAELPSGSSGEPGLPIAAKAAIGTAVPLGVIVVAGFFIYLRRSHRGLTQMANSAQTQVETILLKTGQVETSVVSEMPAAMPSPYAGLRHPAELDGGGIYEIDSRH